MKLKFIKISDLDRNLKATIQKTGKLGFTVEAAIKLKLSKESSISMAVNEDDAADTNLYALVHSTKVKDAFNVNKAGSYYYLSTKPLFDKMKIDYTNKSVTFDISEEEIEGQKMFVFKRREKERIINNDGNEGIQDDW